MHFKDFKKKKDTNGINIYKVKGWDYAEMCEVFEAGIQKMRETHIPAIFHVEEITQPQGHSTSGSHERYKTAERLEWEKEWDCNKKFKEWILENAIASIEELEQIEEESRNFVRDSKQLAWEKFQQPILNQIKKSVELITHINCSDVGMYHQLQQFAANLKDIKEPITKRYYADLKLSY